VVGDERRRVELSGRDQLEHRIHVGDDVCVPRDHAERLDPGQAHVDLDPLGVDTDDRDSPAFPGEPDCQLERVGMADRVDGDVDAAPSCRLLHVPARVALREMDRVRPERLRDRQTILDRVDRHDVRRARGKRGLHGAEPYRPEAENRDQVAGAHAGRGNRVVAGAHHVAREQRDLVGHALRHPPECQVRRRDERLVGLRAL
jgi:hypothetical protein